MRTKLNYLLIVITSIMLYNCSNPIPNRNDFTGIWKCSDGAYILLNKNGTCVLKGVNYFKVSSFPQKKDKKLNAEGTWSYINNIDSGIIDGIDNAIKITYIIPKDNLEGEIVFYVSGQGIFGNNKPWNLFIWDGDPDDMNKYEFVKD